MAIRYAMVARGPVVLAEYSSSSSNANTVARQILERLPSAADTNLSYSQDRYIFHVTKADGLTFLCMADDTFGRKFSLSLSLDALFHIFLDFQLHHFQITNLFSVFFQCTTLKQAISIS